ncbi:MipA/OmpV family protein [Herbaspirillum autotrophicum]|uniref:MipA/OmpV family protein n=1 Tax=Herbaspirillum autotrophicum TaxID=180195 RepID=UPI00067B6931|nr:MipA/OmpV family protein [Herbaspirillum autotrophicum]
MNKILLSNRAHGGRRLPAHLHALRVTTAALLAAGTLICLPAQAAEEAEGNTLRLGAGVGLTSRYSGSDENVVGPVLGIDYQMQNGFYASTTRGIGWGSKTGDLQYSLAVGYRGERKEKKESTFTGNSGSDKLKGMGDIKGSFTAMLSTSYTLTKWLSLSAMVETPLSQRTNGTAIHLGAAGTLYETKADTLSLGVTASIGDSKYLQTYYGVTAVQSGNSGFAAYKPKSGLYAVSTELSWVHQLDKNWSVTSLVGAVGLTGDASKSPIVKRKVSPNAAIFVSYSY